MAYMRVTQRSAAMNCNMEAAVFYPMPDYRTKSIEQIRREKKRTLYLLHDVDQMFLQWVLQSGLYEWAMKEEIVVVMPTVRDYFETRGSTTGDVFSYISRELPEYMQKILPLSKECCGNLIAGVGMGGYYALKTAVRCPERFFCAGVFQKLPDVERYLKDQPEGTPEALLGERFAGSDQDVIAQICKKRQRGEKLPGLFFQFAEKDFEEQGLKVLNRLREAGVEPELMEEETLKKGVEGFVCRNAGGFYGENTDL